jgi:Small-conductance mechanosensitive channel
MLLQTVVEIETTKLEKAVEIFYGYCTDFGITLIKALLVFAIGRLVIMVVNKIVKRILNKNRIDPSVRSFVSSLVNVVLIVLLVISVVGVLGIQTTSFAALLASAGIGIGMALSGNLSNFAGGVIILVFKPFKVGDYIDNLTISGTVTEIQIFHTILLSSDNKEIFVPNGTLSSGVVVNYSIKNTRRVEWSFNINYGENFESVKAIIEDILSKDTRVLPEYGPPFVEINTLVDNKINIIARVWVKRINYTPVYHDTYKLIYHALIEKNISVPTSQIQIQS